MGGTTLLLNDTILNLRTFQMLKEVKAQRDEAQQKLSDLTGHNNTKQKISYVNQLREKIAILESVCSFFEQYRVV